MFLIIVMRNVVFLWVGGVTITYFRSNLLIRPGNVCFIFQHKVIHRKRDGLAKSSLLNRDITSEFLSPSRWIRQSKFYLILESRVDIKLPPRTKVLFLEARGTWHSQFVNPYQQMNAHRKIYNYSSTKKPYHQKAVPNNKRLKQLMAS